MNVRRIVQRLAGPQRLRLLRVFNRWMRPGLSWIVGRYRRTVLRSTRVVAVVGSFGKTTATRATLVALGMPCRDRGRNTWQSIARGLLGTWPGQRRAVLEVAVQGPGEMGPLARMVGADIAVVMSIGSDHHRKFKTLEVTRHEKAEMVRELPATGLAVLNGDDPNVRWMAGETRARVVTFGFGEANDVRAAGVAIESAQRTRFTLHTPAATKIVRTRLLGTPMVYSVLAAVAVGLHEGLPLDEMLGRLAELAPANARLQPVTLPGGAVLLRDDAKAGEETVDAALDVLEAIPARRRMVVFGGLDEPGPSHRTRYRRIGKRIGGMAARAIVIDFGESVRSLRAGLKNGGLPADAVHVVRDASQASAWLSDLGEGDVVLIKGRRAQRMKALVLALLERHA
jgi:UDP-N-acetylmuramoyl-tripeptide--D-alanyl-D-alanine ligase